MRKAILKHARLLFASAIGIIVVVTLTYSKPSTKPENSTDTVNCPKDMEDLKGSGELLWETLSHQFVSSVSCY